MRIAVFHNLPFGGALRSLNAQISLLDDIAVDIYTFSSAAQHPSVEDSQIHRYNFKQINLLHAPFGRFNGLINIWNLRRMQHVCKDLAAEIDEKKYDAVIVGACSLTQTSPILHYLHTPTIYDCPEPFRAMLEAGLKGGPFGSSKDPFRSLYTYAAIKNEYNGLINAKSIVCNSYYTRECVIRSYDVPARVNHRGVDLNLFHPMSLTKENFVLSVGRLSPLKKHDFIATSLSQIPALIRPELRIVCGPATHDEMTPLQELCRHLDVSLVFEPNISDEHLVDLYNRAVVTVFAPVLEPLGLVPLESMACGTPVVGVAEGGIRETIVDGVTGFLTDRSTQDFANAIQSLLNQPELAAQMGIAGRRYVEENWSWEQSVVRLRKIINLALEM
ncbi:MAG: glycosyltransferase family 4 protein [Armatimonadota bacterium]